MPVEFYTQSCKIVGYVASGRVRISDLLNQASRSIIAVESAFVTCFADRKEPVQASKAQVNRNAIVLAVPREPRVLPPITSADKSALYVSKQRHHVVFEAPPFSVTGFIHLLPDARVDDALALIEGQFLALTGAKVSVGGGSLEDFKAETVIVNRSFLHLFYARPEPVSPPHSTRVLTKRG